MDAERSLHTITTSYGTLSASSSSSSSSWIKSETLPASVFLGLALVARGEIGILVLQVAYNASTDANPVLATEPYLIAIWAVAVSTIVGPCWVFEVG